MSQAASGCHEVSWGNWPVSCQDAACAISLHPQFDTMHPIRMCQKQNTFALP